MPSRPIHGHRGSSTGAGQLVGHKGGVFKRLFDRNFNFMAHRHARCAKCACAADSTSEMQVRSTPATAPQKVPQRYRGRRTCRTARNRRCLCRFQLHIHQNALSCSILFRTCLQGFLRNHDGDRLSPGQGSYQRWRERGVHRSRTNRSSSELVRMFKRSRVQNVAQPPSYVECDKPRLSPPPVQPNNTPH